VRSGIADLPVECFVRIDGRGMRERSRKQVLDFLNRHPREKHILIAAATDTSALGALDAVRDCKREKYVAIVGQDCIAEAVEEMRKADSPLVGSVSHEAGSYGPNLVHLGLALLRGQTVAPYNYVEHRMVTPESLNRTSH
jgi:ribose transport system substrate-binding protein